MKELQEIFPNAKDVERAHLLEASKLIARNHKASQNFKDAIGAWETVLTLDKTDVFAWCELGTCWMNLNQLDAARACFKQARRLKPSYVPPLLALADLETFAKPSRARKALSLLELAASKLGPNDLNAAPYHVSRATALAELKRYDEAERAARHAMSLRQEWPPAWSVLGNILTDQGRFEDAIPVNKRAYEMTGDTRLAMNYALACLSVGRWQEGWDAYEARLRDPNHEGYRRFHPTPYWDGKPMKGNLLVFCEQGLGDFFQFGRYLPLLRHLVDGDIILELWPSQMAIAEDMDLGVDRIVHIPELGPPKVKFDRWMALISAVKFSGKLALSECPAPVAIRHEPLSTPGSAAIIWYGNPEFGASDRRDIPLEALRPIIESRPDLHWWCPSPEQRAADDIKRTGLPIEQKRGTLRESAARLAASDFLVSCDTGPAHMAGTLGVPVHLLIPSIWDWRWGAKDATTTPWYAGTRIWRQHHFRDWKGVCQELAAALSLSVTL